MLNRSIIGRVYGPQIFDVERSKIRELALALGDRNPIFNDEQAAAKPPAGGMIAQPTFVTLLNFWVPQDSLYQDMGIDNRYLLHGEQEYEYFADIRPGMTLEVSRTCTKIYSKPGKSGVMEFAVVRSEFRNRADNVLLVTGQATLVLRWPATETQHAPV